MITGFDKIVEERIKQAQRAGSFDDLPGSGKPLEFGAENNIPEDLRLAYKMLKNAGFIPQEVELKKKILQTEELLSEMEDTADKYRILKKINFMIMKLNTLQNRSIAFEIPQHYSSKIVKQFEGR